MTRNKQFRAVLLAALMVLSVFAGAIAFSGSAAADVDDITTDEIGNTSSETISMNVTPVTTTSGLENNTTLWIDENGDGFLNESEPRVINDSFNAQDNTTTTVTVQWDASSFSDGDTIDFAAAATAGGPTNNVTDAEATKTVTVNVTQTTPTDETGSPELTSAVHYVNNGGNDVIELAFTENVNNTDDIRVYQDDEDVTDAIVTDRSQPNPGQVILDVNGVYTGDIVVEVPETVQDGAGNSVSDGLDSDNNATVTVATVTATGDDEDAYRGEVVAITNGQLDQTVSIESDDSQDDNEGYKFSGSTGENSEVFVFDTTNRELERYNYSIDGADGKIDISDLGLEVTVDDLNVTTDESIEGTVSANAGGRDVELQLLDSDGDDVETIGATLDGQGEYDYEFDAEDLDADDYTVEVKDNNSGVTVESDTIAVTEAAEGRADFANNVVTDQRGDVVAIPLTLSNTDRATVTIGSADQGYRANVTVEDGNDDGEVILLWDSSESTSNNVDTVFDVDDSDDDILTGSNDATNITTTTTDLIDAGDYDLEIRTGRVATEDNADNVGTLVLEEGGVQEVQTWTAASSEDFTELEDVTDALDNGNLTQDDQIAFGDKVVVQIVAPGLEGQTGAQDDETPNFFGSDYGDSYRLVINQTNPGPNREAKTLNVTDADEVIADGDNDTYFVVINTETIGAQREDNDDGIFNESLGNTVSTEDDDAYQVNFTMIGEDDVPSGTNALVDDESSMTADYEHVEAEHNFDMDPVNVTNAESQTISGTSNVAPGSELTIRVRSDGDTQPRFLKTSTVYVSENGTFSADFDFSEQSVGDTFTATVRGGVADEVEVDGNVLEQVGTTETTTEETTTTTEETTTTTEETTTTTEATTTTTAATTEETTTSGQTPGFGVVVALVALIAAALLAIRRD